MEAHSVRFGADGFEKSHAVDDLGTGLLAELRSALHPDAGEGDAAVLRAPALLHACAKPKQGCPPPRMWELDEYRDACAELDHSLLAEKRQEVAAVLLGLLGWCGLRWMGKDTEAALYVCVMALGYGGRVYLRTAFRADAVRLGSRAWMS